MVEVPEISSIHSYTSRLSTKSYNYLCKKILLNFFALCNRNDNFEWNLMRKGVKLEIFYFGMNVPLKQIEAIGANLP